ncbi:MAG: Holliday junction branch migration protein RuvA [Prolixibacteraceae bacterium]|jgi:Holliday junction DNA helicase RuvA|nr:Holliday junction branch migration protein RuvA [Prolixibacteraceae bacterium]
MYEYIKGKLTEVTPTYAVLETGGIGYQVFISLTSYQKIQTEQETTLWTHFVVREDVQALYGFAEKEERSMFRNLISVNGVGANTAMVMLSSYPTEDLIGAIQTDNVNLLKSIKGIGAKTAQRIIIDLKDKVGKIEVDSQIVASQNNTNKNEALSAMVMLGFNKKAAENVIDKILKENPSLEVEPIIKLALKSL